MSISGAAASPAFGAVRAWPICYPEGASADQAREAALGLLGNEERLLTCTTDELSRAASSRHVTADELAAAADPLLRAQYAAQQGFREGDGKALNDRDLPLAELASLGMKLARLDRVESLVLRLRLEESVRRGLLDDADHALRHFAEASHRFNGQRGAVAAILGDDPRIFNLSTAKAINGALAHIEREALQRAVALTLRAMHEIDARGRADLLHGAPWPQRMLQQMTALQGLCVVQYAYDAMGAGVAPMAESRAHDFQEVTHPSAKCDALFALATEIEEIDALAQRSEWRPGAERESVQTAWTRAHRAYADLRATFDAVAAKASAALLPYLLEAGAQDPRGCAEAARPDLARLPTGAAALNALSVKMATLMASAGVAEEGFRLSLQLAADEVQRTSPLSLLVRPLGERLVDLKDGLRQVTGHADGSVVAQIGNHLAAYTCMNTGSQQERREAALRALFMRGESARYFLG